MKKHKLSSSLLFPLLSILILLASVAIAVIVTSIRTSHLHLDNGSVWITSLADGKAARFNPAIEDADAAVAASGNSFDVAQSGNATTLDNQTNAYSIDAATLATGTQSSTTPTTAVLLGGSTTAFFDSASGKLWLTSVHNPVEDLLSRSPTLTLPRGSKVTVTPSGVTFVYRASDGVILRFDTPVSRPSTLDSLTDGKRVPALGITAAGDTPVVLTSSTLRWPGGSAKLQDHDHLALQMTPSSDADTGTDSTTTTVAVSSSSAVTVIDLATAGLTRYTSGSDGLPAAPVVSGGCVYAAWASSTRNYTRICAGSAGSKAQPQFLTLASVTPTSDLVFRTNHRSVILNDVGNGNVWNPNDSTNVIKIAWNKLETKDTKSTDSSQKSAQNHENFTDTCSSKDDTIAATDDSFGARAGDERILDVLRNDQQTSCSVLKIEKVETLDSSQGIVASAYDGRYLQLSLKDTASGTLTFTYSISDGRGQTSSATVTLTVSPSTGENAPLQTDTPPDTSVEQGATVSINALDSFTDPDGDPLTLTAASVRNTGSASVTTRADGQLVFDSGAATQGRIGVDVTVSDGVESASGILYFSVKAAHSLAPITDPIVRKVAPGTSVDIGLKDYVHSNSVSPLELDSVTHTDSASVRPNSDDFSLTFSSTTTGTHYVHYTVTQGDQSALGLLRVDVAALNTQDKRPVAVNDVALLDGSDTAILDPLDNDVDPLGGVLAITSVTTAPDSGLKTGVVNHKRLYITAEQVPTKPIAITYRVANAETSSVGRITVQPPRLSNATTAPVAHNVTATVRQNGIVTIPVMDHVTVSDGTDVDLTTHLETDKKTFSGLVFVSGDSVRYLASATMGSFPVTYTVKDNLGNTSSATITITVHQKDAATKQKPQPQDVEAQVVAGHKVKIPITLLGIDEDGDDVSLLGLGNTAPKKGRIDEVGADYLLYEAYPGVNGTDSFQYAVEDWSGQRVTARVRVGILDSVADSGVYARDDTLSMRPGREVDVPVAQNDIAEDDLPLSIEPRVEAEGIGHVSVKNNMLEFKTPNAPGEYYVTYTVRNPAGITDTATLTLTVSDDAPISAPTALDDLVPPAQTIDRRTVDVDVADFISNPSGTVDELSVGVDPSAADHARVKKKKSTVIQVDLTNEARAVAYTVTNTRYHLSATAFIQVPAYGVFPPLLRPKAPALTVKAGEQLTIDLADYVRVGAGKSAFVHSADDVEATQSDGSSLYKDSHTLQFRAPKSYSGPASITFTVYDSAASGASVNSATLSLPITVVGTQTSPPTFSSTLITLAAGEEQKISLPALTSAPAGLESAAASYTYSFSANSTSATTRSSKGVTANVSTSGSLRLAASSSTVPGTTWTLPIWIHYAASKSVQASITVKVVSTTRPLARIPDLHLAASAGKASSIDVLESAYNPFPDTALTIVSAASAADEVTVEWKASGVITVRPVAGAGAMSTTVLFSVKDATGLASRRVTAKVRVSVSDKPDAPRLSPVAGTPQDGRVTLSWSPGPSNGSPITEYEVSWTGATSGSRSCGQATQCSIDGLKNAAVYSFSVRAKNALGWSKPSSSVSATPDTPPSSPEAPRLTNEGVGTVSASWTAPRNEGSAINAYRVSVRCAGVVRDITVAAADTSARLSGLPHSPCTVSISARNGVAWSTQVHSSSITPWGDPSAPSLHIERTGGGKIRGSLSVDTQGQTFTGWKCSVDGVACAVEGGEKTSFTVSVPARIWYAGGEVTLSLTADFAHAGSKSTQRRVTMKKLTTGTVSLTSVERDTATGLLSYRYTVTGGRLPDDKTAFTTRLEISGCDALPQKYSTETITLHVTAACTGARASLELIAYDHILATSTPVDVTDVTARTPNSSGNSPAQFLPSTFEDHLWSLSQTASRYSIEETS